MIIINNIDEKKFEYNGIQYYKNFTPLVVGSDKIRILNTYDSSIELNQFPTLYNEFTVDGNTFADISDLQEALLPVVFTRNSLGGGGAVTSVNGQTDDVIVGLQSVVDNGNTAESIDGDNAIAIDLENGVVDIGLSDTENNTSASISVEKGGKVEIDSQRLDTDENSKVEIKQTIVDENEDLIRKNNISSENEGLKLSSRTDTDEFGVNITTDNLTSNIDVQFEDSGIIATKEWVLANTPQGIFLGSAKPTDTPTGTGEAYWFATQSGTYTDFGGVVVSASSFAIISRDALNNFTISQTGLVVNPSGVNRNYPFTDLATSNTVSNLRDAVLDVELYFTDSSEKYYINYIGNYYLTGGIRRNYFQIKRVSDGVLVAGGYNKNGFWTVASLPTTIDIVPLYNSADELIGRALIDWSKCFNPSGGRVQTTALQGELTKQVIYNRNLFNKEEPKELFSKGVFIAEATINTDAIDVFKAIERVELYNADPLKKYWIKTFARNRVLNNFYYIIIEEEGHSNTTGVAFFNTALTENANGVNVVELASSDNSGITGKVWIDWNKLDVASYPSLISYTIEQTQLASTVHVENGIDGFVELEDRLIVGDDLYLVDEDNLQFFKNSMVTSEAYAGTFGIQNTDFLFTDYFSYAQRLKASELVNASTLKIFNKLRQNSNLYFKDVNINKVTKSSLTGLEANLFLFGDSITDGVSSGQAVTPYVASNLLTWGASPIFKGTRTDGGYPNEGRSSWEFAILIGMRTTYNGTVYTTTDLNITDLTKNPFIKIATPTQITNNPEWCFENTPSVTGGATGSLRELNYTESQLIGTYTGDYYTFDFERYVNTNLGGIDETKKLIVTQALGFNDMNHNAESEQAKNDVLLGMEIFYNRVKEFDIDAIIGFVPIVAVNEDNNWKEYANLIELAIKKAGVLGADIIPVWQHVDRYLSWDFDTVSNLSVDNNSKKATASDTVHPSEIGAKQYANVVSNYIANKL